MIAILECLGMFTETRSQQEDRAPALGELDSKREDQPGRGTAFMTLSQPTISL